MFLHRYWSERRREKLRLSRQVLPLFRQNCPISIQKYEKISTYFLKVFPRSTKAEAWVVKPESVSCTT